LKLSLLKCIRYRTFSVSAMASSAFSVALAVVFMQMTVAVADSFLGDQHVRTVSLKVRGEELQAVLGAVQGCNAGAVSSGHSSRLADIETSLQSLWQTLPKNKHGRVEWKVVRYTVHRHFMQRFGILVRGMEPTIQVNDSNSGEAAIFSSQAPDLAQLIVNGPHAETGFSIGDASAMVNALEQLIFTSERALLEKVFREQGHDVHQPLQRSDLEALMTNFMVYWLFGDDEAGAKQVLRQPDMLPDLIPHWDLVESMALGSVKALEYLRTKSLRPGSGRLVLHGQFTFEDALAVTGDISRGFAFFWDAQCQKIKEPLVAKDKSTTGRVRLVDFYGASDSDGEWRFGESEAYLRELGALDESSSWEGKQVIIPNYLQAASNCVATRPHYLVCCVNECEDILGQLEASLRAPVAEPEDVLRALQGITNGDDEPARTNRDMKRQLQSIASANGNKVPLHGRLFAQWLHHAFPRECPFPHKAGVAAAVTPSQFGDNFAVSKAEVNKHMADEVIRKSLEASGARNMSASTELWMPQWSEEEELIADYSSQLGQSRSRSPLLAMSGVAVVAVALLRIRGWKEGDAPTLEVSHFV